MAETINGGGGMSDYTELRDKAEGVANDITLYEFYEIAQPEMIIELLDLIDELENHILELGERD
jgi:hypothetical protein